MPHHIVRITSAAITATVIAAALPVPMAWPNQQASITHRYWAVHDATPARADATLTTTRVREQPFRIRLNSAAENGAAAVFASIFNATKSSTSLEPSRQPAAQAHAAQWATQSFWWRNASYLWWSAVVVAVTVGAAFWAYRRQR